MSKFKVGDKIRFVGGHHVCSFLTFHTIYTVIGLWNGKIPVIIDDDEVEVAITSYNDFELVNSIDKPMAHMFTEAT